MEDLASLSASHEQLAFGNPPISETGATLNSPWREDFVLQALFRSRPANKAINPSCLVLNRTRQKSGWETGNNSTISPLSVIFLIVHTYLMCEEKANHTKDRNFLNLIGGDSAIRHLMHPGINTCPPSPGVGS